MPSTFRFKLNDVFLAALLYCIYSGQGYAQQIAEYGSTYRIPIADIPINLDPTLSNGPVDRIVLSQVYEGLVKLNDQGQIVPALAESWESQDTGLRWVFHLQKDVSFHDGTPLEAPLVQNSLERVVNPETKSPKSWIFESVIGSREYAVGQASHISGFHIIDPYTFEIQLKVPIPDFLRNLTTLPASIVCVSTTQSSPTKLAGTGPYIIEKNTDRNRIKLVYNSKYHEGRPYLDSMEFLIFHQEQTQLLEFEINRLQETLVPESEFRRISTDERWKDNILQSKKPIYYYLGCNLTRNPVNNVNFRQALSMSLDRNGLIMFMLNGHGSLPQDFCYPLKSSMAGDSIPSPLLFSLETARQLAMPFTRQTVNLLIPAHSDEIKHIAQRIQFSARNAGILLRITEQAYPAYIQSIQGESYDLYLGTYLPELDSPQWILQEFFIESNRGLTGNSTLFYNTDFMGLLKKYSTETSGTNREEICNLINTILWRNLPIIPLYNSSPYLLHQTDVYGLDPFNISQNDYRRVWISNK